MVMLTINWNTSSGDLLLSESNVDLYWKLSGEYSNESQVGCVSMVCLLPTMTHLGID